MAARLKLSAAPAQRPHPRVRAKNQSASAAAARIHRPPAVTVSAAEDKAAHEDQQATRVEMLLLKGITRPEVIGQLLGLNTRTTMRLIDRVHARWEISGGGRTITRFRGEALARLDLVESEAWSRYAALSNRKDPSPRDEAKFLKLLLDIQVQRGVLLGLSPKVVERIGTMPEQQNEVIVRLAAQKGLGDMATRLSQLLAERRAAMSEVIEADAKDDETQD